MNKRQEKFLAAHILRAEQARALPGTRVVEVKDLRAGDTVLSMSTVPNGSAPRTIDRTAPAQARGYTIVFFTDGSQSGHNSSALWTVSA